MKRGLVNNKKGLSAIVATLLIILLTLIAVGIIWVVIRNVVESGAEQIDLSTKCTGVQLSAVTVAPVAGQNGNYTVTLRRGSDSQGDVGVKVNILRATQASSSPIDFGAFGDLDSLNTVTKQINTTVTDADTLEYTAFFRDASNNDQLCSQTGSFQF